MILVGAALAAMSMFAATSLADTMNDEIDYLIGEIGSSGCTFMRNGKFLSARFARGHLRSKRRLNAHLIDSTEEFIEKIASRSVTSGKPYLIKCRGQAAQPAGDWFTGLLAQYRGSYG